MRKPILIILILLFLPLAYGQQTTNDAQLNLVYKYIAQENQKTKDYMRNEMARQLEADHEEIKKLAQEEKTKFFDEANSFFKGWIFRISIIIYTSIVLAGLTIAMIMHRLRHKKIREQRAIISP